MKLRPIFVEVLPKLDDVKAGELWISHKHRTVNLRCPCGCGDLTVLSLHPSRWHVHFDGKVGLSGGSDWWIRVGALRPAAATTLFGTMSWFGWIGSLRIVIRSMQRSSETACLAQRAAVGRLVHGWVACGVDCRGAIDVLSEPSLNGGYQRARVRSERA